MKTDKEIRNIIKKNWLKKTNKEIGESTGLTSSAVRSRGQRMGLPSKGQDFRSGSTTKITVNDQIKLDKDKIVNQNNKKVNELKYRALIQDNDRLTRELNASLLLKQGINPVSYEFTPSNKKSESVAVVLASDWHIEENVRPETVDGFNEYTLKVAEERAEKFFQTVIRLCEVEGTFSQIDTLILALLGDFVSGNIHQALLEICELAPVDAMIVAENMIVGGIQSILDNTKLKLIIPCHVGN